MPLKRVQPGDLLAGRYKIRRLLGQGGMGRVWLAHDAVLNEEVALKTLLEEEEANAADRRRMVDELRVARRVRHKNVCAIYDVGQHDDLLFVTMENIDGPDLHRHLADNRRRLSLRSRFAICDQVLAALAEIHATGLIHRDLKPANVLIDQGGRVHVSDFGLARELPAGTRQSVSVTGPLIGTPGYMSPEQALGRTVDVRSDVYAFGALAFEVFTGQPLFSGANAFDLVLRQATEDPVVPPRSWWDLPPQVKAVIVRCLARDRDRRFPTTADVQQRMAEAASAVLTELQQAGVEDVSEAERLATRARVFRCPDIHDTRARLAPGGIPARGWVVLRNGATAELFVHAAGLPAAALLELAEAVGGFDVGSLETASLLTGDRETPQKPGYSSALGTLLAALVALPGLKKVDLEGYVESEVWDHLQEITPSQLERLEVSSICESLLKVIARWPALKEVLLADYSDDYGAPPRCTEAGWRAFSQNGQVATLYLHLFNMRPFPELSGDGLRTLSLSLETREVEKGLLAAACKAPHLESMTVSWCRNAATLLLELLPGFRIRETRDSVEALRMPDGWPIRQELDRARSTLSMVLSDLQKDGYPRALAILLAARLRMPEDFSNKHLLLEVIRPLRDAGTDVVLELEEGRGYYEIVMPTGTRVRGELRVGPPSLLDPRLLQLVRLYDEWGSVLFHSTAR